MTVCKVKGVDGGDVPTERSPSCQIPHSPKGPCWRLHLIVLVFWPTASLLLLTHRCYQSRLDQQLQWAAFVTIQALIESVCTLLTQHQTADRQQLASECRVAFSSYFSGVVEDQTRAIGRVNVELEFIKWQETERYVTVALCLLSI